jgi:hypothetical protein
MPVEGPEAQRRKGPQRNDKQKQDMFPIRRMNTSIVGSVKVGHILEK